MQWSQSFELECVESKVFRHLLWPKLFKKINFKTKYITLQQVICYNFKFRPMPSFGTTLVLFKHLIGNSLIINGNLL